jgi:hypothetical protein
LSSLTSYGHVVYPHPGNSNMIRRKVRVFERYTRERAAIIYLPGMPCSGQSKADLEIDREVIELNRPRMATLLWYSWTCASVSILGCLYILHVLKNLGTNNAAVNVWQPDVNLGNSIMWYYLSVLAFIPVAACLWNVIAWYLYKRWMTSQHRVLEDGEPANEPDHGCCFDDEECESIEVADYIPPSPKSTDTEGIAKVGIA